MRYVLKANALQFIPLDEKVVSTDERTTVVVRASFRYDRFVLSVVSPNGKRNYDVCGEADITECLTTAGKVSMELIQYEGANVVKKWTVEPFIVKENETGVYKPVPQIEELRERIESQNEQIDLLKSAIRELYKLLTER